MTAGGTVLRRTGDGDVHWWTWAGTAANRTLQASLGDLVDLRQRIGDHVLRLRHGDALADVAALLDATDPATMRRPAADARAVDGLKFSASLPRALAVATVAERLGDTEAAREVLDEHRVLRRDG